MSTESQQSPYPRENFWGSLHQNDSPESQGHSEVEGTDPASYLAYHHLSELTELVCKRSLAKLDREVPLSEPCMYLPKQKETEHGYIEYRQHRHRRRVNPETGWINWGESTGSTISENIPEDVWMMAVHNYLADRGVRHTIADDWLQYARSLYNDPEQTPQEALAQLIRTKRAFDNPKDTTVTEVPV